MKQRLKNLLTGVVAVAMVLTMGNAFPGTVNAADGTKDNSGAQSTPTVTITENTSRAQGTTSPDVTYHIDAQLVPSSDYTGGEGAVSVTDVKNTEAKTTEATITDTATAQAQIDISKFSKPGVFDYRLTNTCTDIDNVQSKSLSVDNSAYTLRVIVESDSNHNLFITSAKVMKDGDENEKYDNITYNNTYVPTTGDDNAGYTIKKQIAGKMADRNQVSTLSVTLTAPAVAKDTKTMNATLTTKDGTTDQSFTSGETVDLKLGDQDKCTLKTIPVGTTIKVVEKNTATVKGAILTHVYVTNQKGYLNNGNNVVQYRSNADATTNNGTQIGETLTTDTTIIGSKDAFTSITSNAGNSVNTGVVMHNMPTIVCVVLLAGALTLYFVSHRKNKMNR